MKRRDHDGTYKLLFSNPQMVRDLMAFVNEPWVEELDFSTLKQAESSLVGKGLSGDPTVRETDLLWRVETRGGQPVYVYLLIELQSTVDLSMALRLLVYVALLYQRLYEKREPGSKEPLPPVMPFVLYNGARKWTAAPSLPSHFPAGEAPVGPTLEEIVDMLPEGIRPWYEDWRDEGRAEGRKEGRKEGVREGVRKGEAQLLERQLTIRFGELPAEVRGRLQKARSKDLRRWAERCLTAPTLDDVFGD